MSTATCPSDRHCLSADYLYQVEALHGYVGLLTPRSDNIAVCLSAAVMLQANTAGGPHTSVWGGQGGRVQPGPAHAVCGKGVWQLKCGRTGGSDTGHCLGEARALCQAFLYETTIIAAFLYSCRTLQSLLTFGTPDKPLFLPRHLLT